jgi:hypothetical protein
VTGGASPRFEVTEPEMKAPAIGEPGLTLAPIHSMIDQIGKLYLRQKVD